MSAKIAHFSELSNILGDKNAMCNEFIRLMGQFGIASSLSRMKMEKEKGAKVSDLLSYLIIFRLCGMSVFESYQQRFMSLINGGKNQFYRLLVRPDMNWRKLLLHVSKTFFRTTKKGNYGLTTKQLKNRTVIKRKDGDCMKTRVKELDKKKPDIALKMIKRAWKNGIHASYLLMDKWYFGIDLMKGVRKIANGAIHIVTLLRDKRTKFQYKGKTKSAKELMQLLGNDVKSCRKYKCRWVSAHALYQDMPVRLFFVRYGHATDFEVIVTTNTKLSFVKVFETYQVRRGIEVINKECKQYLGLGSQQSTTSPYCRTSSNGGQIAWLFNRRCH